MAAGTVFEFDEFRLDRSKRLLYKSGRAVPILPKAFDLLEFLILHRHRALEKDEILQAVWPGTFVSEANLTQNISVLRKTLGESPREHRYIVTIPGRGYRFAAPAREPVATLGDRTRAGQITAKGRHLLNKRLTEAIGESITWFLQATDEDPEFAPAWVGLADAYALLSLYGASLPRDAFPKSRAAAHRTPFGSIHRWPRRTMRSAWSNCSTNGTGTPPSAPFEMRWRSTLTMRTRISATRCC